MGTWVPSSSKLLIIFVYAPQDLTEKRVLWDYILRLIDRWDVDCVIMGDFNEAKTKQERYGSGFNVQVSKGLFASFPFLSALCLDRNLSNHPPILMRELNIDYGPTPFRFFHSWFNLDGFDRMVEDTWKSLATVHSNEYLGKSPVITDGEWIVGPLAVKNVFLKYLSTQFSSPVSHRICFADQFTNSLSFEQQADFEQNVSNEEINSAVWDYGTNKSPGLDGFTFEFFRRYWKLLKHDIVAAVKEFFCYKYFSPGM
ncbi:RNA-directed DNA polymerase, eukaryota [Tanacetum coccineum]